MEYKSVTKIDTENRVGGQKGVFDTVERGKTAVWLVHESKGGNRAKWSKCKGYIFRKWSSICN